MTPAVRYTRRANGSGLRLALTSPVVVHAPQPAIWADPPSLLAVNHGNNVTATTSAPRPAIVHLVIAASSPVAIAVPWVTGARCYRVTRSLTYLAGGNGYPLSSRSLSSQSRCADSGSAAYGMTPPVVTSSPEVMSNSTVDSSIGATSLSIR